EQDRVTVVQKIVHLLPLLLLRQKEFRLNCPVGFCVPRALGKGSLPRELRAPNCRPVEVPERLCADRLLVRLSTEGGTTQVFNTFIFRCNVRRQQRLILALDIDCLLPKLLTSLLAQRQQSSREQRICGTIRR